ncbi:MAG TPA: ATP-binding cassette domain-containing protein [Pseudonocardiaceae bacterium]|nr:ATP-binding cassette domain-containing protein [Pseudonocardiaceae bacterium]
MAEVALEVEGISKRYGEIVALRELSLAVRPGEIFGLVGDAGAGKTTALRIIAGLVPADDGEVHWRSRPESPAAGARLGYLPQRRGLHPRMKLLDHLVYLAELHGLSTNTAHRNAQLWVDRLGLRPYRTEQIRNLSEDNKRRTQLAAAMVHEPDGVVLDEPFAELSAPDLELLANVLRDKAQFGSTVLFASADAELAERVCDRVLMIHGGQALADGTVDELRGRCPVTLVVDVAEAEPDWAAEIPGSRVRERTGSRAVLELDQETDAQAVLAIAQAAGPVVEFCRRQPSLAELYRHVVMAGSDSP